MSENYLDRDISWISFNDRVLDETKKDIPLAEKVMFHGIVASNLEEFMQVRYPAFIESSTSDQIKDFLKAISIHYSRASRKFIAFNKKYQLIQGISKLDKDEMKWLEKYFKDNIFPTLQPITTDKSRDQIFHAGMYVLVSMSDHDESSIGYVEIPKQMDRFIRVPHKNYVIPIEVIIGKFVKYLFRDREVDRVIPFTIRRSAEVYVQPDYYMNPYDLVKSTLSERERSWITYIEVSSDRPKDIKLIRKLIPISSNTVLFMSKYINLSDLKSFPNVYKDTDQFRKFIPAITFPTTSIFDYIKKKDRLAFHPYESYRASFVRFIEEAASDPNVVSIKISLYRVSNDSRIIAALLKAADKGKMVTTMVELKARFDEHHNMEISNILREGGVRIIYTKPNIKTHAKVCLVTRKEKKGLQIYSHVGTGNYSESNSKLYSDYSYFTADQEIGGELSQFFNLLTSEQGRFKSKKIIYAPYNMRDTIIDDLEEQIKLAKKGKKASVIFKCNALTDDKVADKIVSAADAGVNVTLIIRSGCILQPQKNIRIYSVVGRFLEHSRVYMFGSGDDSKVYIGSNDLMVRNLSGRNELMILVEPKDIKSRIIHHMKMYLKDTVNRREITKQYGYENCDVKKHEDEYDVQAAFIKEAKKMSLS